jgi:predicted RNase H-like nuclease (RuvC/YqgF family)
MQFLKLLADVVNFDHWGIQAKRTDIFDSISATAGLIDQDLLSKVDSVTFSDSLCIIRKKEANASGLGMRVGSGIQADVEPVAAESNGSFLIPPSQEHNPVADPKGLSLHRILELKNENQELKNQNQELKNENQELKNENQELKNENQELKNENQELKNENQELKNENQELNKELTAVLDTLSWRITLPLRRIRKLLSSFQSKIQGI